MTDTTEPKPGSMDAALWAAWQAGHNRNPGHGDLADFRAWRERQVPA